MAEQVVNIRERIEKMRTQIYEKPETQQNKSMETQVSKDIVNDEDIIEDNLLTPKDNIISKPEIFHENIDGQKPDEKPSLSSVSTKEIEKKIKEEISDLGSQKKIEQEQKLFKEAPEVLNQEKIKKEKIHKKTFSNYQLKNTFDSDNKSVNVEEKQAFPQFSLNVNNPISWKLMLLIMLMQLLTNIMLVVVLYIK